MRLAVCVAVLLTCSMACAGARAGESLEVEALRRTDALIGEGFNMTRGVLFAAAPVRVELLVPPSHTPRVVALWFAAEEGTVRVRVTDPAGEVLVESTAARVEKRIVAALATGRYVVEVSGAHGQGLIGVKGDVVTPCALDESRVSQHAADPARGFHWPYLLVAAKKEHPTGLLVLPNNTGFATEDPQLLRASATCDVRASLEMADRLRVAMLVPLFPRPAMPGAKLYLHALTRAALETKTPAFARVDQQLVAMIDDAQLPEHVGARVLLQGFSASGSFVNRFAMLHPDRVLAVAVGSPGGWPIAPVFDDPALTYPVGLADVQRLTGARVDLPALRRVDFLFMLGSADENDSVRHRDSFSTSDEALVQRRFGKTPVARWPAAQRLYERAEMHATFKLYKGEGHSLAPAMRSDIEAFFGAALRRH